LFYWTILIGSIWSASKFPWIIENLYFKRFYQIIAISNRALVRWFSFSLGDILYVLSIIYLLYLLANILINFKKPLEYILKLSRFLLLVIGLFYLSWGFNYFRPSIHKVLKIPNKKYTLAQLSEITDTIIEHSNLLQQQLTKNDTLAVDIPYGLQNILNKTFIGYDSIAREIHQKYRLPVIKKSLMSPLISYLHVTGYLNPFTGEAQINYLYPKYAIPFIASHETAHQLGYAPEDEANFLGFLSSIHHPDPYFRYSGYTAALYYLLVELKKADMDLFQKKLKKIHRGILENFAQEARFYRQHRNKYDMSKVYDSYLKLNHQKKGIKSYNEMVKLVISYYLKNNRI